MMESVEATAMHLVQILLPLYDHDGEPLPKELYGDVRTSLVERFGGLTAYTRAPASGLWHDEASTVRDDLVIYEVMTGELDREWWHAYRRQLEKLFAQDVIVVRAHAMRML